MQTAHVSFLGQGRSRNVVQPVRRGNRRFAGIDSSVRADPQLRLGRVKLWRTHERKALKVMATQPARR